MGEMAGVPPPPPPTGGGGYESLDGGAGWSSVFRYVAPHLMSKSDESESDFSETQIKASLNSLDSVRQCEALNKLLYYYYFTDQAEAIINALPSQNVSDRLVPLLPHVVKTLSTDDFSVKRLIHPLIVLYANRQKEVALLCLNCLQQDMLSRDRLVRGATLRTLSGLSIAEAVNVMVESVHHGLTDASPFVRLIAVRAAVKVVCLDIDQRRDMIQRIVPMLGDGELSIVGTAAWGLNFLIFMPHRDSNHRPVGYESVELPESTNMSKAAMQSLKGDLSLLHRYVRNLAVKMPHLEPQNLSAVLNLLSNYHAIFSYNMHVHALVGDKLYMGNILGNNGENSEKSPLVGLNLSQFYSDRVLGGKDMGATCSDLDQFLKNTKTLLKSSLQASVLASCLSALQALLPLLRIREIGELEIDVGGMKICREKVWRRYACDYIRSETLISPLVRCYMRFSPPGHTEAVDLPPSSNCSSEQCVLLLEALAEQANSVPHLLISQVWNFATVSEFDSLAVKKFKLHILFKLAGFSFAFLRGGFNGEGGNETNKNEEQSKGEGTPEALKKSQSSSWLEWRTLVGFIQNTMDGEKINDLLREIGRFLPQLLVELEWCANYESDDVLQEMSIKGISYMALQTYTCVNELSLFQEEFCEGKPEFMATSGMPYLFYKLPHSVDSMREEKSTLTLIRQVNLRALNSLIELVGSPQPDKAAQAVISLRHLLKCHAFSSNEGKSEKLNFNKTLKSLICLLAARLPTLTASGPRSCVIWLLGHYQHELPYLAPDILRTVILTFAQEHNDVKVQILAFALRIWSFHYFNQHSPNFVEKNVKKSNFTPSREEKQREILQTNNSFFPKETSKLLFGKLDKIVTYLFELALHDISYYVRDIGRLYVSLRDCISFFDLSQHCVFFVDRSEGDNIQNAKLGEVFKGEFWDSYKGDDVEKRKFLDFALGYLLEWVSHHNLISERLSSLANEHGSEFFVERSDMFCLDTCSFLLSSNMEGFHPRSYPWVLMTGGGKEREETDKGFGEEEMEGAYAEPIGDKLRDMLSGKPIPERDPAQNISSAHSSSIAMRTNANIAAIPNIPQNTDLEDFFSDESILKGKKPLDWIGQGQQIVDQQTNPPNQSLWNHFDNQQGHIVQGEDDESD